MPPDTAMIFAAGLGTRMGALTANKPKPMILVNGKPLVDHALDVANGSGISNIVINTHYLPEELEEHLSAKKNVAVVREEPELLETGGGIKNALPILGDAPILTLNADAIWTGKNPFTTLITMWRPKRMDALLLLIPRENAQEHQGVGDFFLDTSDRLSRRGTRKSAPFVYSGAQIIKTSALRFISQKKFSLNILWDKMLETESAFGAVHMGGWVDVGRPEGIAVAEAELRRSGNV